MYFTIIFSFKLISFVYTLLPFQCIVFIPLICIKNYMHTHAGLVKINFTYEQYEIQCNSTIKFNYIIICDISINGEKMKQN